MNNNKKYIQETERKLEQFRSAREWSDFMTHLANLVKHLTQMPDSLDFMTLPVQILNKRLNQCLSPSLPAGVHNEVIHVYSIVLDKFKRHIKSRNEKKQVDESVKFLFENIILGLFTFSRFAKIQSKKLYFNLIETKLLDLNIELDVYVRNILLGLLPGMEEDNEMSSQCNILIIKLYEKVHKKSFWNHLWNVYLLCPKHRIPIINFITKNQNLVFNLQELGGDDKSNNTLFYFLSETMLVCSIKSGLCDKENIVIRGTLDILMLFFEIDVFTEKNQIALLENLSMLFIHRDSALNKRIENFIDKENAKLSFLVQRNNDFKIGQKKEETEEITYDYLVLALKRYISHDCIKLALFFKILNTFHDKDELFDYLVRSLLTESIFVAHDCRLKEGFDQVTKQINILIGNSDCWYIWMLIFEHFYSYFIKREFLVKNKNTISKSRDDMDLKSTKVSTNKNTLLNDPKFDDKNFSLSENASHTKSELIEIDREIIFALKKESGNKNFNAKANKKISQKNIVTDFTNPDDNLLKVITFLLTETILGTEENTATHFLFLTILLINNASIFSFKKFVTFIIETSVFIKVRNKVLLSNKPANLIEDIIEFYNSGNDQQTDLIIDSYCSILFDSIRKYLITGENFLLTNKLLIFFIRNYGTEFITKDFLIEYYNFLCNHIKKVNDDIDDLLSKALVIFNIAKEKEMYNELLKQSDKIFMILLEKRNHEFLCRFNLFFERKFEILILDIVYNHHMLPNIIEHFRFCSFKYQTFNFFNLLIVLNEIYIDKENSKDSEILTQLQTFFWDLEEFNQIFLFIIKILHNSSIEHKDQEFLDNPNVSSIKASFRLLETLVKNSTNFHIFLNTQNDAVYSKLRDTGHNSFIKPIISLYTSVLVLFQIHHQEIQLLSIELLNLLYKHEIIDVDEIPISTFLDLFIFIGSIQNHLFFEKLIPTFYILNRSKQTDVSMIVIRYLSVFDVKNYLTYNLINMVFLFLPSDEKNEILRKFCKETESLDFKLKIVKYIDKNIPQFNSSTYKDLINDLMEALFKRCQVLEKPSEYFIKKDVNLYRIITDVSIYLITVNTQVFINFILKKDPNSIYLQIAPIKKELYNQMFLNPNLSVFIFLTKFEDFMDKNDLIQFYECAFDRIIVFFNKQRNKVTISEFYLWYLKKIKEIPDLPVKWVEHTNKIFENINILLSKTIGMNLKRYNTKEERDEIIINILIFTSEVMNKLDSEKYKLILQGFFTLIFQILKMSDGKIFDVALQNLYNISGDRKYLKFYRSEFIEYFYDNKFFIDTRLNFEKKILILKSIVDFDQGVVTEVFDYYEPVKFFRAKDINLVQRSFLLHRLSFLFFCSTKEQLSTFIPVCFEKMVDSINTNSVKLKKDVYFLVRQIVYKIEPNKLLILWPTIISDINSLFKRIINNQISVDDLPLIIEIIKTLEILFIYKNEFFIEFKWICTESYDMFDGENKHTANNNIRSSLQKMEINSPLLLKEEKNLCYFARIANYIREIKNLHSTRIIKDKMVLPEDMEPLMEIDTISSLRDLLFTFENLGLYHKNMDLLSNEINTKKLYELSINDFLNCDLN